MSETIGLIGAGLLGSALADRLLAAGFGVLGFDIDVERRQALETAGGKAAGCASDVAGACSRILLSLPNSDIAAGVLDEIAPVQGSTIIDTTTGDPEVMQGFGESLAARGVDYIDASVGGSSRQVRNGEAIVLAGGTAGAYQRVTDLFACFAHRTFHLGRCGAGARMKLALNLVLGLNRAVLAEGLAFARAYGIDPGDALEVFRAGPAWSRVMDVKGEKMVHGDFTPEARLSQHLKDVRLILAAAARLGAWTPLSGIHRELLEKAEAAGHGSADNSAVILAYLG